MVEDEEDTEKEAEEGETEVPVTNVESDSKDEGALCFLRPGSFFSVCRC